jgi:hypothetical protein
MKSRRVLRHKKRLQRTNQTLRKYKRQRGGAFSFPQISNRNAKRTIVSVRLNANDEDSLPTDMVLSDVEALLEDTQSG